MYVTTAISNDGLAIATVHPEHESFSSFEEALVAVYNEFSDPITVIDMPVYYGNDYAVYEFVVLINGVQHIFDFGPKEYAELQQGVECEIYGEPSTWWQAEN